MLASTLFLSSVYRVEQVEEYGANPALCSQVAFEWVHAVKAISEFEV